MVSNPGGAYRKPGFDESNRPEIYRLNLIRLDEALGQLVDTLKSRGLWDESLLVISSDHNWREDLISNGSKKPGYNSKVRHVPLFIKYPGQREPRLETNTFSMTELSKIFPQ